MGRRKTRKVIKREPKRLPKVFRCPRCGEQSVVVDLDRALSQGRIKCGRCQLSAELPIHTLTQTIDVYAKFLDLYYEGKIEETPLESSPKPEGTSATTQQSNEAPQETAVSQTEVKATSLPAEPETSPSPKKPPQPPETSQQAQ